ncbi:MAG: SDR family oxidoreductase [Anaerolineae bacterium]
MGEPKTLIVTGASRGLGAAVAEVAARRGLNVVMMARSAGDLAAVAERITGAGGQAVAVPGDVTRAEDVERVVETAVARFGRIDALVNNAGVLEPMARIAAMDVAAWEYALAVNVTGPLRLIKAALPYLRQARGRVINISTGSSVRPRTGWGAYSVSKAALNMLTAVLAEEEPDLVCVAVRPGVVDTEMQARIREKGRDSMLPEQYEHFVRLFQTGDLMPPERPARAIVALALHAPRSINGEFVSWDDDVVQGLLRKSND